MLAYKGSVTTTGSSEALRFEKALFRQHPEFRQKAGLEAHVIGPGTLLVQVAATEKPEPEADREDPMIMAFLAFLEHDATATPNRIVPLSSSRVAEAVDLTRAIVVSDDDTIPIDFTF
jgi:antitoxin PrlF